MQTNEDLFVVRRRIAADLDRTRLENLLNAVGRGGHRAPRRGWLGRRLFAVGAFLGADGTTADPRTHAAGPPG